tara:strand:+ start:111 stop:368 length:258 start_codon:yes stop_codon:yes gene_type:complete
MTEAEREQEIADNLAKATKLQIQARKDLDAEIEKGNAAILEIIRVTPVEHQSQLIFIKMKVDKLLNELRSGGDVEEITKKLKALK